MRMSGLSHATGVPVATLKYYLREGLLHPGRATAQTQATYDAGHVARVRLVRALTGSAGLSLSAVREVLAALDDPPTSFHDLLGAAQAVMLAGEHHDGEAEVEDEASRRAAALVAHRGWCDDPMLETRLAAQLRALEGAGIEYSAEHLDALADAADVVARGDVGTVPGEPALALRQVVVGTLLTDPILLTLRRYAQRQVSEAVFGDSPPGSRPADADAASTDR